VESDLDAAAERRAVDRCDGDERKVTNPAEAARGPA
jgi:hypothetical protein